MLMEIKNATIINVNMSTDDHGGLVISVELNYGGSGQSFGNMMTFNPKFPENDVTGFFIYRLMQVVGVGRFENLRGQPVRVKAHHNHIEALGHFIENRWFNFENDIERLMEQTGRDESD